LAISSVLNSLRAKRKMTSSSFPDMDRRMTSPAHLQAAAAIPLWAQNACSVSSRASALPPHGPEAQSRMPKKKATHLEPLILLRGADGAQHMTVSETAVQASTARRWGGVAGMHRAGRLKLSGRRLRPVELAPRAGPPPAAAAGRAGAHTHRLPAPRCDVPLS
jgi:hypothetical protein